MEPVTIKRVSSKQELKTFIRFNYEFYKDCPYSVPDLYDDMLGTFSPKKNAAFEFCEADYFLALKGGKVVGRVAVTPLVLTTLRGMSSELSVRVTGA